MSTRVSALTDQYNQEWDEFVDRHPDGTIYHKTDWRQLVVETFGKESHYLLVRRGDRISGLLPLVRLKSFFFGDFLVSMPYVNYGGILADDDQSRAALLDAARGCGETLGVRHIELRHTDNLASWPVRTDRVSMRLRLTGDRDELWKQLGAKRRSQVKRPMREGVAAESGGAELVDDFYEVFSIKYRDLGVPVYPVGWFRDLVSRFENVARVFVVRLNGAVVAASITLSYNDIVEVPWAASLRSADRLGVNMYLYWQMLEWSENEGFSVFDFGRCEEGSGTWRFKKQWGADQHPLYWHYWLQEGEQLPRLNADNPKYRMAVSMWRKLPVWIANRVGPPIVQNLP